MTQSDEVRSFVGSRYIESARSSGKTEVEVRVGEVHQALGYKNRLPLVCAALGTELFEQQYRVQRLSIEGPLNGSTTLFVFKVLP